MFLPPTFSHVWITLLPYQNHIGNFLGIIVTITNSRPSLEKKKDFYSLTYGDISVTFRNSFSTG